MKTNRHPILLASAVALALATTSGLPAPAWAQSPPEPEAPPAPPRPENPEVQAALEAAEVARVQARTQARAASEAEAVARYAEMLAGAEAEQRAALAAVEAARAELVQQAEAELREAEALRAEAEAREETQAGEQAMREQERQLREEAVRQREERRQVQRELERAHENLRRASREVAQVHRELNRSSARRAPAPSFGANRAVIGVILGNSNDEGVQVLGLSPDGPAERAGLRSGDVIVSLMGEPLVENGSDGRIVLGEALREVEPGDELEIVVQRDGEAVEAIIVAEERTPFSWHSVSRLGVPAAPAPPGAPGAPDAPVVVQSFEFPDIDPEQLEREIEALRGELAERRIVIDTRTIEDGEGIFYEFETLSDVGDAALAGTNIWFGMPLTRGLKFAELDEALGAYFDTDEGVLVLQAKEDNLLQLQSGDVIRAVNGTEVERPADVVRALRGVDSGESVELEIVRRQKSETLVVTIPEQRLGLFEGDFGFDSDFDFDTDLDMDFNGFVFEYLHRDGQDAPKADTPAFPQD